MKTMISNGFRLTAIASLGFWRMWLVGGAAYYYMVQNASLWESFTSGAGIALVMFVGGIFSVMISDAFETVGS